MPGLIAHTNPTQTLAWRGGESLSASRYLADVNHCAARLPTSNHVLLACQDRYAFAVGFGAALVRGQTCLLPSTRNEDLIALLASLHPSLYCLTDEASCSARLPQTDLSKWLQVADDEGKFSVPQIAEKHLAALVYTSGSTGLPVAHPKAWGQLVANVKSEGNRLGVVPGSGFTLIGTVQPQHMYGFESTVLLALQNAVAFEASRPFYPADIERVVAATSRPRALVTTPFHLRAFLTEVTAPSVLDLLISATAPLAQSLAAQTEKKTMAPLIEIYGSTETGQLATRRTTSTAEWTTFDGIELRQSEGQTFASGLQIDGSVLINDVIELASERVFRLHGRTADMVNVAGKSTTLDYLNHQLLSIDGVDDGAFVMPDAKTEGVGNTTRLAAVAVAPGHTAESLQAELRRKIAPAFLPRPLKLVASLPRTGTSKLPREAVLALLKVEPDRSL